MDQKESCKYIISREGWLRVLLKGCPVSQNKAWDKHGHGLCRNDLFPASMQNGQDDDMLSTSRFLSLFPLKCQPNSHGYIREETDDDDESDEDSWEWLPGSHLARRAVSAWSRCSSPCRFVCQFCWSSHWPQLRRKHETATLKMKIMRIMRFIYSDASALFARGHYLQLSELITVGAAKCSIIFQISYNFWPHDL